MLIWLGIQSIFIFNDGIDHEWITSEEEKINWICWLIGIIKLLSVSMRLKWKFLELIIYELKEILKFK